jgi:hypothetical protein
MSDHFTEPVPRQPVQSLVSAHAEFLPFVNPGTLPAHPTPQLIFAPSAKENNVSRAKKKKPKPAQTESETHELPTSKPRLA